MRTMWYRGDPHNNVHPLLDSILFHKLSFQIRHPLNVFHTILPHVPEILPLLINQIKLFVRSLYFLFSVILIKTTPILL